MSTQTLANLVKQMNGRMTTNGWDVVCSYSSDALNMFLKDAYDKGRLAKSVTVTKKGLKDPIFKVTFDVTYNINFGSPRLSFSAVKCAATLSMPILSGSSYTITVPSDPTRPPQTTIIPADDELSYSVVAQVPLAAVDGTTGVPVNHDSGVLVFSDSTSHFSIILQFNNKAGTMFTLEPPPVGDESLDTYFLPAIADYFQNHVNQIDYALAAVNSDAPPDGSEVPVSPKSFVFTTYYDPTHPDDPGVLSLYIQTSESKNPPGSPTPQFQPSGLATSPIPSGYTASLILSYDLMTRVFLEPQLRAEGFTVAFAPTTSGIQATLKKDVSVIATDDHGFSFQYYSCSGLDLSLEDYPMTMKITNGQLDVSWSGSTMSSWSQVAAVEVVNYGSVKLTLSADKKKTIAVTSSDIDIPTIVFTQSDFKQTVEPQPCGIQTIAGCREYDPGFYGGLTYSIPEIRIEFPGFNFFLETNLLAPGNQMIDMDSSAGASTPCDFLLVGKTRTALSRAS